MTDHKTYQRLWARRWRKHPTNRLKARAAGRKHDKIRRRRKARRAYMRNYLKNYYLLHRDEQLAAQKKRYDSDPKLREKTAFRAKKWVRENPIRARQVRRLCTQRRIARIKHALGKPFTVNQWLVKVAIFGWHCAYCQRRLTEKTLEMEHLVPLAKGGKHELKNLVPACRRCNARKGTLLVTP